MSIINSVYIGYPSPPSAINYLVAQVYIFYKSKGSLLIVTLEILFIGIFYSEYSNFIPEIPKNLPSVEGSLDKLNYNKFDTLSQVNLIVFLLKF